MLSKLTLKMFDCSKQQHCSTCCRRHRVENFLHVRFDWKLFPLLSLLSIFYQMILICGEGRMAVFRRRVVVVSLAKNIFALKILIAFGSNILHNILFVCREFRGRIYYSMSVYIRRGDMNSWIYPDDAASV